MSSPEATLIGVLADTTGPHRTRIALAGQEGLEPPTTGFGDRDSGQLSYCPVLQATLHWVQITRPLPHGLAAATTARLPVHAVYVRTARPSNRLLTRG